MPYNRAQYLIPRGGARRPPGGAEQNPVVVRRGGEAGVAVDPLTHSPPPRMNLRSQQPWPIPTRDSLAGRLGLGMEKLTWMDLSEGGRGLPYSLLPVRKRLGKTYLTRWVMRDQYARLTGFGTQFACLSEFDTVVTN